MPNSAAAAYTAACQDAANAGSKELPAAQRYLAQYYLRFSLLDHAAHYAYKCLEHESVSMLCYDAQCYRILFISILGTSIRNKIRPNNVQNIERLEKNTENDKCKKC